MTYSRDNVVTAIEKLVSDEGTLRVRNHVDGNHYKIDHKLKITYKRGKLVIAGVTGNTKVKEEISLEDYKIEDIDIDASTVVIAGDFEFLK